MQPIILVENGSFDYPARVSILDETFLSALNEKFKEILGTVREARLINWMARSLQQDSLKGDNYTFRRASTQARWRDEQKNIGIDECLDDSNRYWLAW